MALKFSVKLSRRGWGFAQMGHGRSAVGALKDALIKARCAVSGDDIRDANIALREAKRQRRDNPVARLTIGNAGPVWVDLWEQGS